MKTDETAGVLGTNDVAALISRARRLGRKKTNPATVRQLARQKKIPARQNSRRGRYSFDPDQVEIWLHGGVLEHQFVVAYDPHEALGQLRELVGAILEPENTEGFYGERAYQEHLCRLCGTMFNEARYEPVRSRAKRLLTGVRGNPAFDCLDLVPDLDI